MAGNRNLYPGYTAFFLFHNPHPEVFADQFLIFTREIALEFKKEARKGIGLTYKTGIIILVKVYDPEEIG